MSNSKPTKVLLLGPIKSGKTVLANFLSDAKDSIGEYRPTVGCRIVEFLLDSPYENGKSNSDNSRELQLWDCSGDPKYHNCLPALASETVAVLLVYDLMNEAHAAELEELYKVWSNYLDLSPSGYLVVARKWGEDGQPNRNKRTIKMGTLARLSRVEWDLEGESAKVHSEFSSFINSALTDVRRKREEQEITILKE